MLPVDDPGILLRKLAIHDDANIEAVLARGLRDEAPPGLDARMLAVARVGASAAVGAAPTAYMGAIERPSDASKRAG